MFDKGEEDCSLRTGKIIKWKNNPKNVWQKEIMQATRFLKLNNFPWLFIELSTNFTANCRLDHKQS